MGCDRRQTLLIPEISLPHTDKKWAICLRNMTVSGWELRASPSFPLHIIATSASSSNLFEGMSTFGSNSFARRLHEFYRLYLVFSRLPEWCLGSRCRLVLGLRGTRSKSSILTEKYIFVLDGTCILNDHNNECMMTAFLLST